MDGAQQQSLQNVLRRLHAGVKTFQLYSPSHAAAGRTVQDVTATLQGYLQRYGAVVLQVGKDRLLAEGATLSEGGLHALAFQCYARNLASIAMLPGISEGEVADLLTILSQDRQTIESSGGVERFALTHDFQHLIVKAVTLRQGVDDALSEAGMAQALTQTRRLSPEQREAVLSTLRSGAAATAALLVRVHEIAGGPSAEGDQVDVEDLLAALETLDRAILDEPVEDQEALLQSLAQGVLQLDERLRTALAPELLSQVVDGGSGRAILGELSGEEIALFVLGPAGQGEVAERLARFLAGLRLPDDKAAEMTALLQKALAADGMKRSFASLLHGSPVQEDRPQGDGWAAIDPLLLSFDRSDETALEVLRTEVSDRAVTHDAIHGLINLIGLQELPEEIADTAQVLAMHLEVLADGQEFDFLTTALQLIQGARTPTDAHRAAIDAELTRVFNAGLMDRLVRSALQAPGEFPEAISRVLAAVRDQAAPHLVRLLEREAEGPRRLRLCTLMAEVCTGRVDLVGRHLPGASSQLTRGLALVLGELRDASAISHLSRLAAHPDYQVRREAIDALWKMPAAQGQAALIEFLHDPDPRIHHHLLEGGDMPHDPRVVDWMQRVVRSSDWTPGAITAKVAAMKALARMRAEEALPLLRRIARARWVFGQGRRTVREAARQVVDTWERSGRRPA